MGRLIAQRGHSKLDLPISDDRPVGGGLPPHRAARVITPADLVVSLATRVAGVQRHLHGYLSGLGEHRMEKCIGESNRCSPSLITAYRRPVPVPNICCTSPPASTRTIFRMSFFHSSPAPVTSSCRRSSRPPV